MSGPFETDREARAAAHAVIAPDAGWSILSESQNRQLLARACEAARVQPGAYGARILSWLAGFEDSTCEVVADLIIRAHAAGKAAAIPPRTVIFGLMADDDYFVLSEALKEFASRQRWEAEDDAAGNAESRIRWAGTADAMLERIEAALSGGTR